MERDATIIYICFFGKISTHTLTWSVTILDYEEYTDKLISTHTLTWSVTSHYCISEEGEEDFNSHAHVERDKALSTLSSRHCHFNSHAHVERDVSALCRGLSKTISTHTLTWSVTYDDAEIYHYKAFQLTRSRGA